jgi:DNA-binding GntR family transcriptional regulator
VSAIEADQHAAQTLDTELGKPILRIKMKATSIDNEIFEYRISNCKLDSLEFYTIHQHYY